MIAIYFFKFYIKFIIAIVVAKKPQENEAVVLSNVLLKFLIAVEVVVEIVLVIDVVKFSCFDFRNVSTTCTERSTRFWRIEQTSAFRLKRLVSRTQY